MPGLVDPILVGVGQRHVGRAAQLQGKLRQGIRRQTFPGMQKTNQVAVGQRQRRSQRHGDIRRVLTTQADAWIVGEPGQHARDGNGGRGRIDHAELPVPQKLGFQRRDRGFDRSNRLIAHDHQQRHTRRFRRFQLVRQHGGSVPPIVVVAMYPRSVGVLVQRQPDAGSAPPLPKRARGVACQPQRRGQTPAGGAADGVEVLLDRVDQAAQPRVFLSQRVQFG